jgi:EAL domain-containing protein (putative c-di-GMP-specific phosphodiesterase class I)
MLKETGFAPERLKFELTETAMLSDEDRARRVLGELRELGIHISLDDFGTGYSALRLLAELPLSCIKIDRSLVMNADSDPRRQRLLRGIMEMSTHLGLDVVAEGIETEAERALLVELGCPTGQGFFFARPMPMVEALKLVGSSAS